MLLFGFGSTDAKKNREFFTIAHVLTSTLTVCRRNRGDPSLLRVRYKYYQKNMVVSVWPGAAHSPIAV